MELKCNTPCLFAAQKRCSNRTFMELKYFQKAQTDLQRAVLIAPLWN